MKFCIKTLGCKVNTYESEYIYSLFLEKGYIYNEEEPDIYVVNTCTVTNMSDRKCRQVIHGIRKNNPNAILVVCGCSSENAYQTNKLNDIDADIILGNYGKGKIVKYVEDYLKNKEKIEAFTDMKKVDFENMEITKTHSRTRAFVKIEDGCNNFCTYCVIPYVRGRVRSKKHELVIEEVTSLVNNGYKEIVLTGIHTGAYNDEGYNFANLLKDLVEIKGLQRLRISSIEINELTDEVLEIFKNNDVLVPHLHVPLQSGSEEILKLMNRKYNKEFFINKINYIRSIKKDINFTTDVIVGFPGETDEMHKESMETIKQIKFSKIHSFPYSDRTGTVASKMPNKVDGNVKKERMRELLDISNKLEQEYYENFYGRVMEVLIEEEKDGYFIGHTKNFIKVKLEGDYKINTEVSIELTKDNVFVNL